MKIAIPAENASFECLIDTRFGRAPFFVIYNDQDKSLVIASNDQNLNASQGAGIQAAANIVNSGCGVLICAHCGPKAFSVFQKAGVDVFSTEIVTIKEAIELYSSGSLRKMNAADVEGHW